MGRVGRADFEEADVQRLLRLDRAQRLTGHGAQHGGIERLPAVRRTVRACATGPVAAEGSAMRQ